MSKIFQIRNKKMLKIFLTSIGSLAAMFVFTKLIGNKQMSQLNMFDYINGITIGSIAAEMATNIDINPIHPIIAMSVYGVVIWAISFISQKSLTLRRFFEGRSLMLFGNNKIYRENFKTAKLSINEFLTQCRTNGYFSLSQIEEAFIEPNGQISFNPKSTDRPLTPNDVGLSPSPETAGFSIILDGYILEENLKKCGKDINWLNSELHRLSIGSAKDIFFAYCGNDNRLTAYKKVADKPDNDRFQ